MLLIGRELKLPLDLIRGSPPNNSSQTIPDYVANLKNQLNSIHSDVRNKLQVKSDRMKSRFDIKTHMIYFQPNQKVWFYNPRRIKGKTPKLQCDWEGPYVIKNKLNDVVYRIQRSPHSKPRVIHINRIAPYED